MANPKVALVPYTVPALSITGLTGSTAASRYCGATASGAPTTGAHLLGDWVIDQTAKIWVCTVAGTPGTWAQVGGGGGAGVPATTVQAETSFGVGSAVGTSTNYAREDHTHGTPATPATSVAGRTGAVTLTAADIAAGTFPGANSYTGLQTFNAGLTIPAGQPMTTGNRSIFTGTRATSTNASDTIDMGSFATTGGALNLRIHVHLTAASAGTTASVTKVYEIATTLLMGTVSTWYTAVPADSSGVQSTTNDFDLEVNRSATATFSFRFRQKSIGVLGSISFTVEAIGDTPVTFTPSSTVTAAPAAATNYHPSNPIGAFGSDVLIADGSTLRSIPRGLIATSTSSTATTGSITTTETAYPSQSDFTYPAVNGRKYLIIAVVQGFSSTTGDVVGFRLRYSSSGAALTYGASPNGTLVQEARLHINNGTNAGTTVLIGQVTATATRTDHIGVGVLRQAGAGNVTAGAASAGSIIYVIDIGG